LFIIIMYISIYVFTNNPVKEILVKGVLGTPTSPIISIPTPTKTKIKQTVGRHYDCKFCEGKQYLILHGDNESFKLKCENGNWTRAEY